MTYKLEPIDLKTGERTEISFKNISERDMFAKLARHLLVRINARKRTTRERPLTLKVNAGYGGAARKFPGQICLVVGLKRIDVVARQGSATVTITPLPESARSTKKPAA